MQTRKTTCLRTVEPFLSEVHVVMMNVEVKQWRKVCLKMCVPLADLTSMRGGRVLPVVMNGCSSVAAGRTLRWSNGDEERSWRMDSRGSGGAWWSSS